MSPFLLILAGFALFTLGLLLGTMLRGAQAVKEPVAFSSQTAQKWMKVAQNEALTNPAHGRVLPQSWTTLYELTKLPEPTLRAEGDEMIVHCTPRKERERLAEYLK